jgi:hypothetical protein
MKKATLIFIGILSMSFIYAQDITDALRYSKDGIQGTARYKALSGAFGALGGDMSAISINPAGSSVFNTSHFSLTLSNEYDKKDIQYYNGFDNASNSNFDLNQIGAAFVFKNGNKESDWKKFTLGISYNKIEDYENGWFVQGTNPNNSIGSYFLEYANGLRLDEISAFEGESYSSAYLDIGNIYGYDNQQAFLGYESYILEPETNDDANTLYSSNISGGNYNQKYYYASNGYNGKFTVNASTQYGDNLFLGMNLNTHFINFERSTLIIENNDNDESFIKEVGFENNLFTIGSGVSLQFGGIIKPIEQLRIGLTYDTPTWYYIRDETTQNISATRDESGALITQIINPQVLNIYPSYSLQTPGKFTGSLAYVFGNYGLISFDYSIKDYGNVKFKPTTDSYFLSQNNVISNKLTVASTFKIGAEYRFKQLSFRGGYRLEESPYKNGTTVSDLTGYSVGLGYSFGKLRLDLTFDEWQRESNQELYQVGLTDTASIDTRNYNFSMSLSMNL